MRVGRKQKGRKENRATRHVHDRRVTMDKVSCVTPYHTKKYLLPYGDIMHEHDITELYRHDSCIGKLRRIFRVKQTKPTTHGRYRLHMVVMMIKYLKDLEVYIHDLALSFFYGGVAFENSVLDKKEWISCFSSSISLLYTD